MSDELNDQELSEFFAGLEGYMSAAAATEDVCLEPDECYMHNRLTLSAEVESEDMTTGFRCTYEGPRAILTYVAVDVTGYAFTRTEFYQVGEGVIGSKRPKLATEKPGTNVDKVHEEYLEVLRKGKEL